MQVVRKVELDKSNEQMLSLDPELEFYMDDKRCWKQVILHLFCTFYTGLVDLVFFNLDFSFER